MNSFSEDNPKYRCCFQCIHVRTAALIIGLVHCVSVLIVFIRFVQTDATIYTYTPAHTFKILENETIIDVPYDPRFKDVVPAVVSGVILFFSIIAVVCLFWGVCKNRSIFLIPELAILLATMVICVLAILFFVIVLGLDKSELNVYIKEQMQASGYDDMPDTVRFIAKIVAGAGIVVFAIALILTFCFYRIVRLCYNYLKEKEAFLKNEPVGARYSYQGAEGSARERQPIVIIQPPSSGEGNSPPVPDMEKN